MEGMFAFFFYGAASLVCILGGVWIARKGLSDRADRGAGVVALSLTSLWCLAIASLGSDRPIVYAIEVLRNLAWLLVLLRAFGNDGRDESMRIVRPMLAALAFVELLQLPLLFLLYDPALGEDALGLVIETSALFRVLLAVGALVLVHNLYAGATSSSRRLLRWSAAALAVFWGWELNHFFIVYLTSAVTAELALIRAGVAAIVAVMFALGFNRASSGMRFQPSRVVTFQSLSLGLIGAYLLAMLFTAELVGRFSGDLARVMQVGFLLAGAAAAMIFLPSERLRRWLRVKALKHLFKHRYDYRSEWIRFTHTIGRKADAEKTLQERAVQSLADIAGCTSGLLLVPDEDGSFMLGARWQWPGVSVPAEALPAELVRIFEREHLILDFDEVRRSVSHYGEVELIPDWMRAEPALWAAVPLVHHDRLVGVVLLARPQVPRPLDWEDFDLLTVAGQQVASYLAEQAGQDALNQASQFDEFNRRMAFVMHDIKNLSSQMSLLLRNAERHADNPEFRKDMLLTLRNSADKLNVLLARLGRYRGAKSEPSESFDLAAMARDLRDRFSQTHPIEMSDNGKCVITGEREALEQALAHLIQNAIEASEEDSPVTLEVQNTGLRGQIAVVDNGSGMSASFVRNELFRPFTSSKEGGFGIGAYEARATVRAMGGRLTVESREGLGSRFEVSLPLSSATKLIEGLQSASPSSNSSEAA